MSTILSETVYVFAYFLFVSVICQKAENRVPFKVWMKHCCMLLYWNPGVSGCFCPWTPSTGKSPGPCATGAWRFTFLEKWVVHEYLQPYYTFCVLFFQTITAMGVYIMLRILLRKMQTPAQVPAHTGMLTNLTWTSITCKIAVPEQKCFFKINICSHQYYCIFPDCVKCSYFISALQYHWLCELQLFSLF